MSDVAPQEASPAEAEQAVLMAQVEELLAADEQAEHQLPEETPAPEPEAEDDRSEPETPRGDLRVALREERERHRQAEQDAANAKANQRLLAAAFEQVQRQINPQPQQPQVQIPDFEAEQAGHLKFQLEQTRANLQYLQQMQAREQQSKQQEAALAQATNAVVSQEAQFVKQNPDYYDAVGFMREKLATRFKTLGVPEQHLEAAVAQDMRAFGLKALQAGANPAEKIFQLAKIEGYNGPSQADSQRLSTIARGQQATRGARSSAPASNGHLTLEAAQKLSYKDLAAMSDTAWAKLMGGA